MGKGVWVEYLGTPNTTQGPLKMVIVIQHAFIKNKFKVVWYKLKCCVLPTNKWLSKSMTGEQGREKREKREEREERRERRERREKREEQRRREVREEREERRRERREERREEKRIGSIIMEKIERIGLGGD
jgi:predicted acyl esterase